MNIRKHIIGLYAIAIVLTMMLSGCRMEVNDEVAVSHPTASDDRLLVLCEGLWGMDNSTISLIDHGVLDQAPPCLPPRVQVLFLHPSSIR